MSRAAIRAALETRLALISAPTVPAWPTSWENKKFVVPTSRQYQEAYVLFGRTVAAGFGKNAKKRWVGVFHINIHIAADKGPAVADARSKALEEHFARGTALFDPDSTAKVVCEVPYPGSVDSTEADYMVPLIVPWFCYVA